MANEPLNTNLGVGSNYHVPVLYKECLQALQIKPNGVYVDCTFGGGGHSKGILQHLGKEGKLFAFDQDADAQQNVLVDDRLVFVPQNFKYVQKFLRLYGVDKVDGLLADLGVSSHQFDEGDRGFSTRFDGPLDMRMNAQASLTAQVVLATYSANQLQWLFQEYGQVTNAKSLAQHIVQYRGTVALATINQFKQFIYPLVKGNPNKYLAQVFQALRIEVNQELNVLKELLVQLPTILKENGIAAIITFHSGEDKLVKNYFKHQRFEVEEENLNPFSNTSKQVLLKPLTKKPIEASKEEQKSNPRSRSAKLRVAIKI